MNTFHAFLIAASVAAAAAAPAQAADVSWQVNVSQPGVSLQVAQGARAFNDGVVYVAQPRHHHHHAPRVVYVQPQVAYPAVPVYQAQPAYPVAMPARWEQPRVVVVRERGWREQPVYVEVRGHRHGHHCRHGHGHGRGWERDDD